MGLLLKCQRDNEREVLSEGGKKWKAGLGG